MTHTPAAGAARAPVPPYDPMWPWPNFTPAEIACRCGCGSTHIDTPSMDALQLLRETWGRPIVLTSAHRCMAHNRAVGGTATSRHLQVAFDCVCPRTDQARFIRMAEAAGFTGIGQYPARGFVHLDCGPRRRWHG